MERLKEQYRKDIKEQQKQMENRIKAEVDLYKGDIDAIAEQNREMKEKMEKMDKAMEEKDHEIRRRKVLFFVGILICFNLLSIRSVCFVVF